MELLSGMVGFDSLRKRYFIFHIYFIFDSFRRVALQQVGFQGALRNISLHH